MKNYDELLSKVKEYHLDAMSFNLDVWHYTVRIDDFINDMISIQQEHGEPAENDILLSDIPDDLPTSYNSVSVDNNVFCLSNQYGKVEFLIPNKVTHIGYDHSSKYYKSPALPVLLDIHDDHFFVYDGEWKKYDYPILDTAVDINLLVKIAR